MSSSSSMKDGGNFVFLCGGWGHVERFYKERFSLINDDRKRDWGQSLGLSSDVVETMVVVGG